MALCERPHRWVFQEQEAARGKGWRQQTTGTNLPPEQPGIIAGKKNAHLLSRCEDIIYVVEDIKEKKKTTYGELCLEREPVRYEFVVETPTQILPSH